MTKHLSNKVQIWSIHDLERHYQSKTKGHWFDKSALRFFKSRLSETLVYLEDRILFFSSEQYDSVSPRRYSIREYEPETGNIETIGLGFQGYKTLSAAKIAATKMAAKNDPKRQIASADL